MKVYIDKQGWHSGESASSPASHQCGPGLILAPVFRVEKHTVQLSANLLHASSGKWWNYSG